MASNCTYREPCTRLRDVFPNHRDAVVHGSVKSNDVKRGKNFLGGPAPSLTDSMVSVCDQSFRQADGPQESREGHASAGNISYTFTKWTQRSSRTLL